MHNEIARPVNSGFLFSLLHLPLSPKIIFYSRPSFIILYHGKHTLATITNWVSLTRHFQWKPTKTPAPNHHQSPINLPPKHNQDKPTMSNPGEPTKRRAPGDAMADLAASLLSSPTQSHHHHHHHHHSQPTNTTDTTNRNITTDDDNADASTHAMAHTGAWKPALDRRQSWSAQEYKHDLLKRQYMDGGAGKEGGGFSEV